MFVRRLILLRGAMETPIFSIGARGRPATPAVFAFDEGPPKFDSSARNLLILIGHVSVEVDGLPVACRDGVKS